MTVEKPCVHCGRRITYRKKWAKTWGQVKYCSDECRRAKKTAPRDEDQLLALLNARARGKTICPSEILSEDEKQDHDRMEEVRRAARRLVHLGQIEITQKGQVVDPSAFKGPIRLRLK